MRTLDDLAGLALAGIDDPAQALTAHSIRSCLRYLQREAETAGLLMTAHLISTAMLAALEEGIPAQGKLVN